MANPIEAKEWLLSVLFESKQNGKININGNIYIDKKPSSENEDIVINSVTMNSDFFQMGIFNVNCYVPDLEINAGGKVQFMPNKTRLKQVTEEVYKVIKDFSVSQLYRAYVDEIRQEQEIEENTHFMNFRIILNAKNK